MVIDRRALIGLVKMAMPGVDSGETVLEGADSLIFKEGFLYSYNDNISVAIPLPADMPMEGAVKAKEFFNLINRLKEDSLKVEQKDGKWSIKCGPAKAELTLLEAPTAGSISKLHEAKQSWAKLPTNFFINMELCLLADNKSAFSGVFAKDQFILSTDEIRICWYGLDGTIASQFWISNKACSDLIKISGSVCEYCVDNVWVHFKSGNGSIFSCKRIADDKYPFALISKIVTANKKGKDDIGGSIPTSAIEAINRASAFSGKMDESDVVRLTFDSQRLEVYSERPSGKYTENIKWGKPISVISPITVFVDINMATNGIKRSEEFYLKDTLGKDGSVNTKIVFSNKNGLQIVGTIKEESK